MFLEVRPKRVPHWTLVSSEKCYFIVRQDTDQSIRCNEWSRLVWELCDGDRTLGEIMKLLADSLPEAQEVEEDVETAIDLLYQLKAIEYSD